MSDIDMIATLEQESRQMRARMERLESERDEILDALIQCSAVLKTIFYETKDELAKHVIQRKIDIANYAIAKVKGSM